MLDKLIRPNYNKAGTYSYKSLMAQLHINNIVVGNNPANVLAPFQFEITFECFSELPGTVDWKIIYIGSPSNNQHDQIIDSFDMDHLNPGTMSFQVESNPPNFNLIPPEEIIGTTAILISVSYEKQQFFRVGYYVRNEYEENFEAPPQVSLKDLNRYILSDSPRIFRFEIQWAAKQGQAVQDTNMLQQNIEIMGGDPFQSSNGALQQLQQVNYSYGMFNNQEQGQKGFN